LKPTKFNFCLLRKHFQNLESIVTFKHNDNSKVLNGPIYLIRAQIYHTVLKMKAQLHSSLFLLLPATDTLPSTKQLTTVISRDYTLPSAGGLIIQSQYVPRTSKCPSTHSCSHWL